jgi:hypothetical protein
MFYSVTDYATAGQNTLNFTRYYNSRTNTLAELGAKTGVQPTTALSGSTPRLPLVFNAPMARP